MKEFYIATSSILAIVSYVVYVVAILQGKAKPQRATRFVVLFICIVATLSLFAQGSVSSIWLTSVFTFGSIIIFLLSIPYGMGGWSKTDVICIMLALFGVVLWKISTNPFFALLFSIEADFVGQIPLLIKSYRFPKTEVWYFYFLDVLASICNIGIISQWKLFDLVFPLYIICIDSIIVLLILRSKLIPNFINQQRK